MPVTAAERNVRPFVVARVCLKINLVICTINLNVKNPEGSLRSFPDFFQWLTLMV